MPLSVDRLRSLNEAAARRASGNIDDAVPGTPNHQVASHQVASLLDQTLLAITDLTGRRQPLSAGEEGRLLEHLRVVTQGDLPLQGEDVEVFASAYHVLERMVRGGQPVFRPQGSAAYIAGGSLSDGVFASLRRVPFRIIRLGTTPVFPGKFKVEGVLQKLAWENGEIDNRADRIARRLADLGVYTAPFDSWRVRLAVEGAGGVEAGVRLHLERALIYRDAIRRFVDPQKDHLVVLVGFGKKDRKGNLNGLPSAEYLVSFRNRSPKTIGCLTFVPGVARGEPGEDGIRQSRPGDWRRKGDTIVPRNGFIDPEAAAPNVLALDLNTPAGDNVLSNLMNTSLERAVRKQGCMVETRRLMFLMELRDAIQKGSFAPANSGGGGLEEESPVEDGDFAELEDEGPSGILPPVNPTASGPGLGVLGAGAASFAGSSAAVFVKAV